MLKSILILFLIFSSITSKSNDDCNVENCISCPSSPDTCEKCKDEYFLTNNICDDCAINCRICTGTSTADCQQCNQKYALDSDNLCQFIGIENCLKTDESKTKCSKCITGYELDSEGKCIPATSCQVEKCVDCSDDVAICKKCDKEYYLVNNTCNDCSINCQECTDATTQG